MSWSYRIVRHADGHHDMREVWVDKAGRITGVAAIPADLSWYLDYAEAGEVDARAALVSALERMLAAARDQPIVAMPGTPLENGRG